MINVGTFCELPGENSGLEGHQAGLWRCRAGAGAEGKKAKGGAVPVVEQGAKVEPFEHAEVINEELGGSCSAVGPRRLFHHWGNGVSKHSCCKAFPVTHSLHPDEQHPSPAPLTTTPAQHEVRAVVIPPALSTTTELSPPTPPPLFLPAGAGSLPDQQIRPSCSFITRLIGQVTLTW